VQNIVFCGHEPCMIRIFFRKSVGKRGGRGSGRMVAVCGEEYCAQFEFDKRLATREPIAAGRVVPV
jgi:hypothetical protein